MSEFERWLYRYMQSQQAGDSEVDLSSAPAETKTTGHVVVPGLQIKESLEMDENGANVKRSSTNNS